MSKKNNWKNREGIVYSTLPDFSYDTSSVAVQQTLPPQRQQLKISLDKSGRAGKQVTLISGFVGTAGDLENLTKLLKTKCGAGGSAKAGDILIQGDVRHKIMDFLRTAGYQVKGIGF